MNSEPVTIWSLAEAERYHVHSRGLAQWMCEYFDTKLPVFDFGCGKGTYVKTLIDNGFGAIGFEATPGIEAIADTRYIVSMNITMPMSPPKTKGTVICIEVLEHLLPGNQEQAALTNLVNHCDDTLVMSWAVLGQNGHGHNNCRDAEYVIERLRNRGFRLDKKRTSEARSEAVKYDVYLQFFEQSLYVFKRNK